MTFVIAQALMLGSDHVEENDVCLRLIEYAHPVMPTIGCRVVSIQTVGLIAHKRQYPKVITNSAI